MMVTCSKGSCYISLEGWNVRKEEKETNNILKTIKLWRNDFFFWNKIFNLFYFLYIHITVVKYTYNGPYMNTTSLILLVLNVRLGKSPKRKISPTPHACSTSTCIEKELYIIQVTRKLYFYTHLHNTFSKSH